MLFAGQEKGRVHTPSLFERDSLIWNGHGTDGTDLDLSPLIRRLSDMKKDPIFTDSTYKLHVLNNDTVVGIHTTNTWRPDDFAAFNGDVMIGFFPMKGESLAFELSDIQVADGQTLNTVVPDGIYENLVDGSLTEISLGRMHTDGKAVIIRCRKDDRSL